MDECFLLTKELKNAYVLVTFTQHIFQIHLDKLSQCISRINKSNCNIDNGRLYLIHIYLIGNIAKHFINKKQFNAQFAQIKLLHNTIFEQVSIKCPSRYFSSLADSVYKEFISGIILEYHDLIEKTYIVYLLYDQIYINTFQARDITRDYKKSNNVVCLNILNYLDEIYPETFIIVYKDCTIKYIKKWNDPNRTIYCKKYVGNSSFWKIQKNNIDKEWELCNV